MQSDTSICGGNLSTVTDFIRLYPDHIFIFTGHGILEEPGEERTRPANAMERLVLQGSRRTHGLKTSHAQRTLSTKCQQQQVDRRRVWTSLAAEKSYAYRM